MEGAQYQNAKVEIQRLVDKLKQVKESGKLKSYNEENTKKDFITPMFRALGWDVENRDTSDEVTNEDKISKGRVDYAFRINGIPKFFLEAKALNKGLDETVDSAQAINYAWHKSTSWAILTDFQTLIIYNAEVKGKTISDSQFIRLTYDQFVDQFDRLYWLSKPAFLEGRLDKEALSWGKKLRKTKVGEQLLSELMGYRTLLSKNILKNNSSKNLTEEEIDEAVQKIIDRLIFIRTTEDRQIEPPTLRPKIREFSEGKRGKMTSALNEIYLQFDKAYNSKLFTFNPSHLEERHLCETLDIDNEVLFEVIEGLYQSKDGLIHYDFSAIDADVLGNIYEQYLSHILSRTEKRAKVESKEAHRKEQGIYYTPTYIVDYIVRNTLGEVLKNKKPAEADKIRVLDMACGSGSFLLKAFDTLDEYYKRKEKDYAQAKLDVESDSAKITRKTKILKNNIYGVDLDPKAVEIAQLNLLLKAAETRHRLPDLRENIKCGNSLIDDPVVVGERAFDWNKEFETIMKEGRFDVVIGNPPYVDIKQLDPRIVKYFFSAYSTVENRMNLYSVFVERALSLLKDGGYFGFIIPNSILYNESYAEVRKLLLEATNLKVIVRLPDNVFEDAKVETIILIFQKKKRSKNEKCLLYIYPRNAQITSIGKENCQQILSIDQNIWVSNGIFNISTNANSSMLIKKIETNTIKLIDLCDFSLGLTPYDKYRGHTQKQIEERVFHSISKKDASFKPLLSGENIVRYGIFWDEKEYISYGNWLGAPRDKRFFISPRIVVRQIISGKLPRIYAGYTEEEFYNTQIAFNLVLKDKTTSTKYVLAIINSKLLNFYHREKYLDPSKNLFQKILIANAKQFPIKIASRDVQKRVVDIVDIMLSKCKQFNMIKNKQTDERAKLEKEISETDKKIDELVYDLYNLTQEERKIVEETVK